MMVFDWTHRSLKTAKLHLLFRFLGSPGQTKQVCPDRQIRLAHDMTALFDKSMNGISTKQYKTSNLNFKSIKALVSIPLLYLSLYCSAT